MYIVTVKHESDICIRYLYFEKMIYVNVKMPLRSLGFVISRQEF
jgi:hypothetical protein